MAAASLALAASAAHAAPPTEGFRRPSSALESDWLSARTCAVLFGDVAQRESNAAARQAQLDWVDEEPGGVTVAHRNGRWRAPIGLRLQGLRFIATVEGRTAPQVVVEVTRGLAAAASCPAGRYALERDRNLTPVTRILAVLDHGALVEHRGELRYFASAAAPYPRWLMAWRMRAELSLLDTPGAPAAVITY